MRSKPAVQPPGAIAREQPKPASTSADDGAVPPASETGGDETPPESMPPERPAPGSAATEIELKLLVDPEDLAAFEAAPVIVENTRGRGVRRRLRAVYFDTPNRDLRRAGMALRVRQTGSRFVQTVKSARGDDPLRRGEWEAELPGEAPDLALALPLLPPKLRARLGAVPPAPVFRTDIRRLTRQVTLPAGRIEVAFDVGRLLAGDASVAVSEIELELKSGSAEAIFELGLRLLEHGAARPSVRSKSDRGFDLADDLPPAAPKPRRPDVPENASLDEAFLVISRSVLGHLLEALPAAGDGRGGEGVHQTRVALRRLRALLGLMRAATDAPATAAFRDDAGRIAGALGGARDTDVFITETLATVEAALPGLDGFDRLRRIAEARRTEHYAEARRMLGDQRTSRFLLELGAWIEQRGWRSSTGTDGLAALAAPASAFAAQSLAALHAKVLKRGKHFKDMAPEARHRLRIAVKKLRYASDFLAPMLGDARALRRYLAALAALQSRLGRYNDMATTARIVAELGAEPAAPSEAAGAVVGWQAHGLAAAEPQLRDAWDRFRRVRPPWDRPAPR